MDRRVSDAVVVGTEKDRVSHTSPPSSEALLVSCSEEAAAKIREQMPLSTSEAKGQAEELSYYANGQASELEAQALP